MKYVFLFVFFLLYNIPSSYSQKALSDYSYVIVAEQFSFQSEKDKFQLNSLTKFLFNKYGFHAYFDKEVPNNVKRCDGLWADVERDNGFIYTKLKIIITDCNGRVVFRSFEGSSKEKDYKKAYYESIREAFISIEDLYIKQKDISDSEIGLIYNTPKSNKNDDASETVVKEGISKNNAEIKSESIPEKSSELAAVAVVTDKNVIDNNTEKTPKKPKTTAKENLPSSKYSSYIFNNKNFLLRKTSIGYSLYEEINGSEEELLLIGKIELAADTLIFIEKDSEKLEAYFDNSKNLTVLKDEKAIIYKLVH